MAQERKKEVKVIIPLTDIFASLKDDFPTEFRDKAATDLSEVEVDMAGRKLTFMFGEESD